MIVAGLTGGIGSGKSVAARLFRERGAAVISADEIAHRTIRRGGPAYDPVVALFGEGILSPDGEIDRKRLAAIVFDDPERREKLNRIVHPLVFRQAERLIEEIRRERPDAVVVFEVPLLIESGGHRRVDRVVAVTAARALRVRRLVQRDRLTQEQAEKRIDAQMPDEEKARFADYVIDGDRPIGEIEKQVDEIYRALVRIEHGERSN
jgi:dephospho-CoA kinase